MDKGTEHGWSTESQVWPKWRNCSPTWASQIILVTLEWGSQSNPPFIHMPSCLQVDFWGSRWHTDQSRSGWGAVRTWNRRGLGTPTLHPGLGTCLAGGLHMAGSPDGGRWPSGILAPMLGPPGVKGYNWCSSIIQLEKNVITFHITFSLRLWKLRCDVFMDFTAWSKINQRHLGSVPLTQGGRPLQATWEPLERTDGPRSRKSWLQFL